MRTTHRAMTIALLVAVWGGISSFAAQTGPKLLAEADKLYAEMSYAQAARNYEQALKLGIPARRKDEVRYRIAVSLGKSRKFDLALQVSLDFVKKRRGTVWEARGLYWLGRLYTALPPTGYRVGNRVYRGDNVPRTSGGEAPEFASLRDQDAINGRDAFEAAAVLFPRFRKEFHTEAEETALYYDMTRILQQDPRYPEWLAEPMKWAAPEDPSWSFELGQAYEPEWPQPKKMVYLYRQIGALARTDTERAKELLAESIWLKGYHELMKSAAVRYENDKPIPVPYPYQSQRADPVLRKLIGYYPFLPIRDQAQILLAEWLRSDGKMNDAIAEYQALISARPKSPWVSDAKAAIAEILRHGVAVSPIDSGKDGIRPRVQVQYRNLAKLHFKVWRIDLAAAVVASAAGKKPTDAQLTSFGSTLGTMASARKFLGPLVSEWDRAVTDDGAHRHHEQPVEMPAKGAGAYYVEVSAPSIRAATVVLATNLAVVQKTHRDGVLLFACDRRTGAPVAGAQVLVKRYWQVNNKPHASLERTVTDRRGLASVAAIHPAGANDCQVAALAKYGGSYAISQVAEEYLARGNEPTANYRAYCTTDRSVYRPRQTVHYRELVLRRAPAGLKPVVGQAVSIQVRNPQGQTIHERKLRTGEFGSVNGKFDLAEGAPLGEYFVQVGIERTPGDANSLSYLNEPGGNRFRVEEYKKPEFEVTVTPTADRVKLGQPITAKVKATYYFGGGVPNAKVTYRVHRSPYSQQYQFPRPFDFLWRYWGEGDYDTSYRNGAVVQQGTVRTDANGEATVKVVPPVFRANLSREGALPGTAAADGREDQEDQAYTIEADVQDSSRRTITGSGTVKATKHDVAVFLNYPHGYATQGDQVDVEIMTLNPSDQPVSVSGQARVYRKPVDPKGKETLVHEEQLTTDDHGRAYLRWKASVSGNFRIAFETHDRNVLSDPPNAKIPVSVVEGSLDLWVDGPELAQGRFHQEELIVAVKNPYYTEGQTARVLIVTPAPGCTVFLTRDANDLLMEKRVIRVPERSLEVEIPLGHGDVPNVYLTAVLVRDGKAYTTQQEIFVPPVRQFSEVSVNADKERYQPGEKATFRLSAKDWQGRPLRTELSVSVSDAALTYIQKSYAPDVRAYLYGDRRSDSTEVMHSLDARFDSAQEDRQPEIRYERHQWLMPEAGMVDEGRGVFGDRVRLKITAKEAVGAGKDEDSPFAVGRPAGMARGGMGGGVFLDSRIDTSHWDGGRGTGVLVQGAVQIDRGGGLDGPFALPVLRKNFADTAFWTPAVVTDRDGNATVQVTWPDNLTQWRASTVGISAGAQVGTADTTVRTKKDLLVRLQTPRFSVERDQATITANVQSDLKEEAKVQVQLEVEGDAATAIGTLADLVSVKTLNRARLVKTVTVAAGGEGRVDWTLTSLKPGRVLLRVTAQCDKAADATEAVVPVLIHGVERMTTQTGVLRGGTANVRVDLPLDRKPGSSDLVVHLNPTVATVALDALPYLADYPYGCVEQTMSRFLPSVIVAKTLKDMGYDLKDLRARAKNLAEQARKHPGSKPVANSPYTYPKGMPGSFQPVVDPDNPRLSNPVFDERRLNAMVREGLKKLKDWQHGDGGWGWWKDDGSDPYMTASVLQGLQLARAAGVTLDRSIVANGLDYLAKQAGKTTDLQMLAFETRVLSMESARTGVVRPLTLKLFDRREHLSAYSKALLATTLAAINEKEKAHVVLRNLESIAQIDAANGTASWQDADLCWWRWYNDRVETHAAILEAYLAAAPDSRMLPMVVKWLVNNRRGDAWFSTKQTALAVLALTDYARANHELSADFTVNVDLVGRVRRSFKIDRRSALLGDNIFIVPDALLMTGNNALQIGLKGKGTLYWSASTRYFSQEEPIPAASHEIAVSRRYFRLIPGTAQGAPEYVPIDPHRPNPFLTGRYELLTQGGEWRGNGDTDGGPRYDRVELADGAPVESGDMIDVDLALDAKNDYDYVLFEDMKPSGCEPVELRSGGKAGQGVYSNMELRDQKVAFFISSLPQGTRRLSYRLRAETPGKFHVLPTNGYAMYAPEVRALSAERSLVVHDSNP